MVSRDYARGWDDCLEAISVILHETEKIEDIEKKIAYIRNLVREKRFDNIKYELGISKDIF